jgi:hypothetical protein
VPSTESQEPVYFFSPITRKSNEGWVGGLLFSWMDSSDQSLGFTETWKWIWYSYWTFQGFYIENHYSWRDFVCQYFPLRCTKWTATLCPLNSQAILKDSLNVFHHDISGLILSSAMSDVKVRTVVMQTGHHCWKVFLNITQACHPETDGVCKKHIRFIQVLNSHEIHVFEHAVHATSPRSTLWSQDSRCVR